MHILRHRNTRGVFAKEWSTTEDGEELFVFCNAEGQISNTGFQFTISRENRALWTPCSPKKRKPLRS